MTKEESIKKIVAVIKARFPHLTVEDTLGIAFKIAAELEIL